MHFCGFIMAIADMINSNIPYTKLEHIFNYFDKRKVFKESVCRSILDPSDVRLGLRKWENKEKKVGDGEFIKEGLSSTFTPSWISAQGHKSLVLISLACLSELHTHTAHTQTLIHSLTGVADE